MQHLLRVVPVVGLLAKKEDFRPSLNTDEVDAIFDVPLEMFLKVFSSNPVTLELQFLQNLKGHGNFCCAMNQDHNKQHRTKIILKGTRVVFFNDCGNSLVQDKTQN